jgi:hypothetical protein
MRKRKTETCYQSIIPLALQCDTPSHLAHRPHLVARLSPLGADIVDQIILDDLFDDKFLLLDADTDAPMRFTEYAVKRGNGSIEFGTTDDLGHTHLLTATAASESIDAYL